MNIYSKAKWWTKTSNGKVRCTLCPRYCTLADGQSGFCYIRKNVDNQLVSFGYGRPSGFGIDPIEKKPLYHFLPSTKTLSFGTAGCNLGCKFCQNWTLSKAKGESGKADIYYSPEDVLTIAIENKTPSISFTYNEPTIFGEYIIDIAQLAKSEKIKTVMVTAGYIDKIARNEIYQNIDAANVDLKGFTEEFYNKYTLSKLSPVLDTLIWLKKETNIHFEITNLIVPEANDNYYQVKNMIDWILGNLGPDIPLHFSAFYPTFKLTDRIATPTNTILEVVRIAVAAGIKFCYPGNIGPTTANSTFCPHCSAKLIDRNNYRINYNKIYQGNCYNCGNKINGLFN